MRDVADELLQDVSDLLFKELAIFNLMQRLNDPGVDIEMTTSKQVIAIGKCILLKNN